MQRPSSKAGAGGETAKMDPDINRNGLDTALRKKNPLKYYYTATKEDWHRKTVSKRDKLQSDLAAGLNIDGTRYRYRWTGVSPMGIVATEG